MSKKRVVCIVICVLLFMGMLYFVSSRGGVKEAGAKTQTVTASAEVGEKENKKEEKKEKSENKKVKESVKTNKEEEAKKAFEKEREKTAQTDETADKKISDNAKSGEENAQDILKKVSAAEEEAEEKVNRTAKEITNKIVGKNEEEERALKEQKRKEAAEREIKEILAVEKIEFETASAKLTPKGREIVVKISKILKKYPEFKIEIAGHTDSSGKADFNRKLSLQRAETVKKALVEEGIDKERLVAKGYGSSKPLVQKEGEEKIKENRRVEFHIVK